MTAAPAEEVAGDLLRATGQIEPPARIDRVVALLPGLNVSVEPLDNDGYIIDVPGGAEIIVNARASLVRQRFTLAHELGHYALQVGLGDSTPLSRHSDIERWCDRFAVGLLLPAAWVKRFVEGVPTTKLASQISRGPRLFQVSRLAFWSRVHEVARIWAFELADDGSLASDVRPAPPTEVLRLAQSCADRASSRSSSSLSAYGLRASCIRVSAGHPAGERSFAVVAPETPRFQASLRA